jgi:hypothetical protein
MGVGVRVAVVVVVVVRGKRFGYLYDPKQSSHQPPHSTPIPPSSDLTHLQNPPNLPLINPLRRPSSDLIDHVRPGE